MNHAFGTGPIQLLRRQREFFLGFGEVASRNSRPHFADLRLDRRFGGTILGAALQALPQSLLGTLCSWHERSGGLCPPAS